MAEAEKTELDLNGVRGAVYRELEPGANNGPGLSWTNRILVVLVLLSFVTLAFETELNLQLGSETDSVIGVTGEAELEPVADSNVSVDAIKALYAFNWVVVIVFAIEYIARFWVTGVDPQYRGVQGRLRHAFSIYSLADLAAFLPELILLIFTGPSSQYVAALKALRLFRLLKLTRYIPAFDLLGKAIKKSRGQLLTTLFLALALVYISAIALYYIEGALQPEAFGSIPRAIWWAIATLTTVGYGDVYPLTPLGRIAASMIALAGIGVVALPAGVFAGAFSDVIREENEAKEKARNSQ